VSAKASEFGVKATDVVADKITELKQKATDVIAEHQTKAKVGMHLASNKFLRWSPKY
jgi:hypothetical protein